MATIKPLDLPGPSGELLSGLAEVLQGMGMENEQRNTFRLLGSVGWGSLPGRAALPPPLLQSWVSLEERAAPSSSALDTGVPLSCPGAQQDQ